MKRGNLRTHRIYGSKKIKYAVEGRKSGIWKPITIKRKIKNNFNCIFDLEYDACGMLMSIIEMSGGKH